jgi:hypothetical protein
MSTFKRSRNAEKIAASLSGIQSSCSPRDRAHDRQPEHPLEFTGVVGDQGCILGQCVERDPEIISADRGPGRPESGELGSVVVADAAVGRVLDRDLPGEALHAPQDLGFASAATAVAYDPLPVRRQKSSSNPSRTPSSARPSCSGCRIRSPFSAFHARGDSEARRG